jgi:prepilin-type N-terminal cleavage/methylation domain-containing protein
MTQALQQTAPSARRAARLGFTLLELMLVLAIIAMISAIAIPRLSDIFERQKLRGAANDLRLVWDTARIIAMRTGQAQIFNCVPGTGSYTVKPLMLQTDATNVGQGATVMLATGAAGETTATGQLTAAAPVATEGEQLEEKITFVSCIVMGTMQAYATAQAAQVSGNSDISTQNMGQTVIFYPDGSASTAEVQIQNERGDIRAVQIRGLTGHSRVVDIVNVPSSPDAKTSGGG